MKKRIFGAPTIPTPQDDDSDCELQPAHARNKHTSLYSALMGEIEDSSEKEEQSERESETEDAPRPSTVSANKQKKKKKEEQSERESETEDAPRPSTVSVNKQKKKKKKKKKRKPVEDQDVEAVIEQVQALLGEASAPAPSAPAPPAAPEPPPALCVDLRSLNVVHEIKKNYRVDVLKEDNPPERRQRSSWFRKTTFVQPRKGWQQVRNTDLYMKLERTDAAGVEYFVFVHGERYRRTQLQFLSIVHADDRPALEQLLADNPHHIDSRLLVAHVDGMLKRYAESKENVEFALFTLEHVLHKSFHYASGRCRLEYVHFENRAFHILLLKLARYHYNLACHNTALQLCKLLLLLDPTDPLGVTLLVDAVALRAAQYETLIQSIEYWDVQHRALCLPNMGFAYALAHFCLATQQDNSAELIKKADKLLNSAIRKWPCVVLHILEKCGSLRLRNLRDLPLYRDQTEQLNGAVLCCLSRLTAERQFPVWKRPAQLAWLEREASVAGAARESAEAARGRRAVFRRPPPQLLRNLTVLNHSRLAPPDSDMDVQAFPVTDPYPPPDGISPYHVSANPYWRNKGRPHQPFNPLQFLGL